MIPFMDTPKCKEIIINIHEDKKLDTSKLNNLIKNSLGEIVNYKLRVVINRCLLLDLEIPSKVDNISIINSSGYMSFEESTMDINKQEVVIDNSKIVITTEKFILRSLYDGKEDYKYMILIAENEQEAVKNYKWNNNYKEFSDDIQEVRLLNNVYHIETEPLNRAINLRVDGFSSRVQLYNKIAEISMDLKIDRYTSLPTNALIKGLYEIDNIITYCPNNAFFLKEKTSKPNSDNSIINRKL